MDGRVLTCDRIRQRRVVPNTVPEKKALGTGHVSEDPVPRPSPQTMSTGRLRHPRSQGRRRWEPASHATPSVFDETVKRC